MKQNLGHVDRILRFALAFWWLGPIAPLYTVGWANGLTVIIGWIALIESFFGWCYIHQVLKLSNKN